MDQSFKKMIAVGFAAVVCVVLFFQLVYLLFGGFGIVAVILGILLTMLVGMITIGVGYLIYEMTRDTFPNFWKDWK